MTTQPDIWTRLAEPFPPQEVKQRQGPGGRMLSYVDARAVAQRLDDVLTPARWNFTCAVIPGTDVVKGRLELYVSTHADAGSDGYAHLTAVREDHGYPNSDRDEEPIKAATSDALKRCAVLFGIGRHLYDDNRQGTGRAAPPPVARPAARSSVTVPDDDLDFSQLSPTPPGQTMTWPELADLATAKGLEKVAIYQAADRMFGKGTKVTALDGGARYSIAVELGLVAA